MSFEEPWACIGIASSATMGSIADSKLDMGPVLHKGDVPAIRIDAGTQRDRPRAPRGGSQQARWNNHHQRNFRVLPDQHSR